MIVAKFGGSSMADAAQIKKVAQITSKDEYKVVVVSAPGKRFKGDEKITDMLYAMRENPSRWQDIYQRLYKIEEELNISHSSSEHFRENRNSLKTLDDFASRGEYYSARIFAEFTGRIFVDTSELICIKKDGRADEESYERIKNHLATNERYAIPGFYGRDEMNHIKTFSRGGSDITGSIFARALNADVYENWTDVSGVFAADPNVIKNARKIDEMTYTELLLLGENGAQVFHPLAVEPVRDLIPINIKNTNSPSDSGTIINKTRDYSCCPIIAVTYKDNLLSVIGEGRIIEQIRGSNIEEVYRKYFSS